MVCMQNWEKPIGYNYTAKTLPAFNHSVLAEVIMVMATALSNQFTANEGHR